MRAPVSTRRHLQTSLYVQFSSSHNQYLICEAPRPQCGRCRGRQRRKMPTPSATVGASVQGDARVGTTASALTEARPPRHRLRDHLWLLQTLAQGAEKGKERLRLRSR